MGAGRQGASVAGGGKAAEKGIADTSEAKALIESKQLPQR